MAQVKRREEAENSWDEGREVARGVEVDNRKGWEAHGEAIQRFGKTLPDAVLESIVGKLENRR